MNSTENRIVDEKPPYRRLGRLGRHRRPNGKKATCREFGGEKGVYQQRYERRHNQGSAALGELGWASAARFPRIRDAIHANRQCPPWLKLFEISASTGVKSLESPDGEMEAFTRSIETDKTTFVA